MDSMKDPSAAERKRSGDDSECEEDLFPSKGDATHEMMGGAGNHHRKRAKNDSRVVSSSSGHALLLSVQDAGRIYLSGEYSATLTSTLEGSTLTPIFGYDLNFPPIHDAKTDI